MTIFILGDITTEAQAIKIALELVDEAIDASEAQRRKRQKIRSCMSKIKRLTKKCTTRKWSKPIKDLKESFQLLEEHIGELDVNLFGI